MVQSKTDLFDHDLQKKASIFKVLSHPARLQIIQYLIQSRKCITGDISEHFPLGRTTVNQHIKDLKEAGIICSHFEGSKVVYCLDCEKLKELEDVLSGLLSDIHLAEDFKCCLESAFRN